MRDGKDGLFYEQKSAGRRPLPRGTSARAVAGTTDKLFCEGIKSGFFVESRDPTEDFGLRITGSMIKKSSIFFIDNSVKIRNDNTNSACSEMNEATLYG